MIMGQFPGKYSCGDIVKFKYRSKGIVKGQIVGCLVNSYGFESQYIDYKVHSLPGEEPVFFFKSVSEHHIIDDY